MAVVALCLAGCTPHNSQPAGGSTPRGTGGSAVPGTASITVTAEGGDQVSPRTPIAVRAANGTLTTVTVTNPKGTNVSGTLSADKANWTSTDLLGYDTVYTVTADGTGKDGKPMHQTGTVHTVKPGKQSFPSMIPAVGQSDFGVGQPISIQFDQPVTDKKAAEAAVTVTSTPAQPGGWFWIDAKTLHFRPKDYWQPGTTVVVAANVYGVNLGNHVYGKADRTNTLHIHDSWVAKADGDTEQMQILHNGGVVNTMPISMGKDATPTHVGPHVIQSKYQTYHMDSCSYGVCGGPAAYSADEKWAERISNDGEFVHENPHSVGQQGSANVSHGCINLNAANATWFYNNLGPGDVVEVVNSGGPKLPAWDLWGDWDIPWEQFTAYAPAPTGTPPAGTPPAGTPSAGTPSTPTSH